MDHIQIKVKRELFRFSSCQEWFNKTREIYKNFGLTPSQCIAIDSFGRVITMTRVDRLQNKVFEPMTVYELETR